MARWAKTGAATVVLAIGLVLAPAAGAAIPNVFGSLACAPQPADGNVRLCGGTTKTWDTATKVDVNVILPPQPSAGADGPYPAIGVFHGWGGSKIGITAQTRRWAEHGYVVFSMSDRGWGNSCGFGDLEKALSPCAAGYNHLMDDRYEVRDAQFLLSVLADEGVVQPTKIGATGFSYGGGISMALAALRNRTMKPDGSLMQWKSPGGLAMELAAAVPQWPWSDLAYSLMPNGRTLDYVADAPYLGPDGKAPIGVMKQSFVSGLYGTGQVSSNYALPLSDPGADLVTWFARINAGEPYDADPTATSIVAEILAHHSSYYIDHSQPPAPLLIQSGWNDDLFPVDEAIRFYNRTRTQFPGDPISLYLMDDGHQRSQNKEADAKAFEARQDAWFDHYLKGTGPAPSSTAEALTTTCGGPSEGPYSAPSWRQLAPGEIRFDGAAAQTIVPGAGDPSTGLAFDPIGGTGACASASGADPAGVASYRLPPAPAAGFTLLGSPTVVADIASSPNSELAARLVDVAPAGTESLVARGLLRPGSGGKGFVFQLHPQGYRFVAGHIAKLELLPADAPYARTANAQAPITVSNLQLRLPVLEKPGALGGLVEEPAPKVLPPGYRLAAGYYPGDGGATVRGPGTASLGKGRIRATRRALLLRLRCDGPGDCAGSLTVSLGGKRSAPGRPRVLAASAYSIAGNRAQRVRLPLTKAGRRIVAAHRRHRKPRRFQARLSLADSARAAPLVAVRPVQVGARRR